MILAALTPGAAYAATTGVGAAATPTTPTTIPYKQPTRQKTPYQAERVAHQAGVIDPIRRVDIATSKDENYLQYRIPAMVVTNDGTIVTSYDGRHTVADLPSHIDNLVRISHDGGRSWGDQIVARSGAYPAGFGDPALGYNPKTNRIFRFYTGSIDTGFASGHAGTSATDPNVLQNLVSYSDDDGRTWQDENVTTQTKDPSWLGMFATSGTATYVSTGQYKGRLIEMYPVRTPQGTGVVAAWTDDNGKTWQHGTPTAYGAGNETKTVALSNGELMLSLRGTGNRLSAISTDGGATWGPLKTEQQLVDPNDNGSIVRLYPDAPASDPKSKILLETNNDDPAIRQNTIVRMSCDDGQTWPISKLLQPGSSAYSTAVVVPGSTKVDVLYERDGYKHITFESFDLKALGGVCAPVTLPATIALHAGDTTSVPVTVTNQQQSALPAGTLTVASTPYVTGSIAVPAIAAGGTATVSVPVAADAQAPAAAEPVTATYTTRAGTSSVAGQAAITRGTVVSATPIDDSSIGALNGQTLVDLSDHLPALQGAAGGSISVTFNTTSTAAVQTLFAATEKALHNYDMMLTLNSGTPYFEMRAGSSSYITRFTSSTDVADGKDHTLTLTAAGGVTTLRLDGTVIGNQNGQTFFSTLPAIDTVTAGGGTFQPSGGGAPANQWFFTGTIGNVTVTTQQTVGAAPTPQPAVQIEPDLDVYHYVAAHGLGAGDQGSYLVRVTNTGNVAIGGLTSSGSIPLGACPGGTLAPGASVICRGAYTFTSADVAARAFTPQVTVTGTAAGAAFTATQKGVTLPLPAPFVLPKAPAASPTALAKCTPNTIQPTGAVANTEESLANHGAEDTPATNAIDGNPNTFWSSGWSVGVQQFPNWIIVDLGKATDVCGITYTPRQSNTNGNIGDWRAYVSNDPNHFTTPVAGGTFAGGTATQTAYFPRAAKGRYLKLAAYNDIGSRNTQTTTIAELSVHAIDPHYVAPTGQPPLIPEPASMHPDHGPSFHLTSSTVIVTDSATADIGTQLAGLLRPATGFTLPVVGAAPARSRDTITLAVSPSAGSADEAYTLQVTGKGVTVRGTTPEAVFDGVQTLRQLLPEAINATTVRSGEWTIAPITVKDQPRFSYRGGMLDVGRRFYPVNAVEKFIDYLAQYKFNALHLHLTEDQGWRIAIDAYPALTQVGASVQSGIPAGTVDNGVAGPWFYTKTQYQQIVDYAKARFIQVIPEIDGPGHAGAAMSAVANLNCNDTPIAPWSNFGRGPHFCLDAAHIDNVKTFLTNVMADVAGQTPGEFIGVGGDEAAGITAAQYTQYTQIANDAVTANGKKVLAWNSWEDGAGLPAGGVLENYAQTTGDPTLAPDVAKALAAGNKILMAPADRTYLDIKYDATVPFGLAWIDRGYTDLANAYQWDPDTAVPDGNGGSVPVTDSQVFGVEFALWSDDTNQHGEVPWTAAAPFAPVTTYIDTMLFPRLPAIAEIAWSPKADRASDAVLFQDFQARLVNQAQGWDAAGIGYHRAADVPWKSVGAPALPGSGG